MVNTLAAANNRAIELLFGVAGGASIASGSGKNIADAMRQIVSQIEQSGVTSLEFTASDASLQKLRESIRKAVSNIKVTVDGADIGSTRAPGTAGASAGAEDLDTRTQEVRRLTDLYKQYYDFQLKSARTKFPEVSDSYATRAAELYDTIIQRQNIYGIQLENVPKLYAKVEQWERRVANELEKHAFATEEAVAKQRALSAATLQSDVPLKQLSTTLQSTKRSLESLEAADSTRLSVEVEKLREFTERYQTLSAQMNRLRSLDDDGNYRWGDTTVNDFNRILTSARLLNQEVSGYLNTLNGSNAALVRQENSYAKLANRAQDYYNRISRTLRRNPTMDSQMQNLIGRLRRSDFNSVTEASKAFQELQFSIRASGLETETLGQTVSRVFSEKFGYGVMASAALAARNALSSMYQNVVAIDAKLADLQVVSGASDNELAEYFDQAAESAQRVASSITDVIDATAVYRRLGFGVQDSLDFAELTTMYSRIGDVAIEEAESNITSVIKAFDFVTGDELSVAMDKMVKVANDYAIGADELGEGLGNAASALTAAGNSFEESLAILTAAQTVTQNASKSSTAVRTITARLRQSTTELEELGEELDPSYNTKSSYRDRLLAITGVDILEEDQQTYKSTFQILQELATVWDELADIDQASVVGMVAGVRQTNVFASLMSQWSEAERVMETAANAAGTMDRAYGIYTDSIEGRVNQLTASFQKLSTSIVDDRVVKGAVTGANLLVDAFDNLIEKVGLLGTLAAAGGIVALTRSVGRAKWIALENVPTYVPAATRNECAA